MPPKKPLDRPSVELKNIKLDALTKLQQLRADRVRFNQEEERREVELEKLQIECEEARRRTKNPDIFDTYICSVIATMQVVYERTYGDTAFKPLFNEDEREVIKKKILSRIDKL